MKPAELAKAYRAFFQTELGKDLFSRIEMLRQSRLEATDAASNEECVMAANQAAGIKSVLSHIRFIQALDGKGGKGS